MTRCRLSMAWRASAITGILLSSCSRHEQPAGPGERSDASSIASAFRRAASVAGRSLVHIEVQAQPRLADLLTMPLSAGPLLGSGSGFVLTSEGLILTNNHVVAEALSVSVLLADSRRLDAAVIGRDPNTDIALLRVQAENLTPAPLGDSDSLHVGDWLLVLGFPLGLNTTVTAGIVSALARHPGIIGAMDAPAPLEHFIQTDAAINPGNSGGPVVDLDGRVVGLSTAILSPTGYFAGYGFAVPINLARRVVEDLVKFGEVQRPDLGVTLEDPTPADAEVYGLDAVRGAEIIAVREGGPASAAGLQPGDVILAAEDDPIRSAGDLLDRLARRTPGDLVPLRVVRYGRARSVEVVLGRLQLRAPPTPGQVHPGALQSGFQVMDGPEGVVVLDVARYGPAARAGLRPGQVIQAAFRQPVRSAAELKAELLRHPTTGAVSLHVYDPRLGARIINFRPEPAHALR